MPNVGVLEIKVIDHVDLQFFVFYIQLIGLDETQPKLGIAMALSKNSISYLTPKPVNVAYRQRKSKNKRNFEPQLENALKY